MHRSFARSRAALVLLLPGELDDQDGVLGGQADQHDEADLRQDVDRHPACEQAGNGSQQAHRHDQDDGQRQLPALVLGDQNEKDEEGGHAEHEQGGVPRCCCW